MKRKLIAILAVVLCSCWAGNTPPAETETVTAETTISSAVTEEVTTTEMTEIKETETSFTENVSETTIKQITETEIVSTTEDENVETSTEDDKTYVLSAAERYPVIDKEWHQTNIFKCGLVPVWTEKSGEKKYGYADRNGNIVIEPKWDIVWEFSDRGVAVVGSKIGENEWNANIYRYGFIDINGNTLVEPVYDDVVVEDKNELDMQQSRFTDGYICVIEKDRSSSDDGKDYTEKMYFVDPEGNRLTDGYDVFRNDFGLPIYGYFKNGYAGVIKKSDKLMQITNYSGVIKSVPCYEYSWINTKGEVAGTLSRPFCNVGAYFDRGSQYSPSYIVSDFTKDGYALVNDQTSYDNENMLITADGKELLVGEGIGPYEIFEGGNLLGTKYNDDGTNTSVILDTDGNIIYETDWSLDALDSEHIRTGFFGQNREYTYGLISSKGETYFEPQFDVTYGTDIDGILMYGRIGDAVYAVKDDHTTELLSDELYNDVEKDRYMWFEYEKIHILSHGYSYILKETEGYRPEVTLFYKGDQVFKGDLFSISHDGYIVDESLKLYDKTGAFTLPDGYTAEHVYNAVMAYD